MACLDHQTNSSLRVESSLSFTVIDESVAPGEGPAMLERHRMGELVLKHHWDIVSGPCLKKERWRCGRGGKDYGHPTAECWGSWQPLLTLMFTDILLENIHLKHNFAKSFASQPSLFHTLYPDTIRVSLEDGRCPLIFSSGHPPKEIGFACQWHRTWSHSFQSFALADMTKKKA